MYNQRIRKICLHSENTTVTLTLVFESKMLNVFKNEENIIKIYK